MEIKTAVRRSGSRVRGTVNDTERRWSTRRHLGERIDEVRYELAMCEACGSVGASGDLEEELLEELAELEYALVRGDLELYFRWALPYGRGEGK